MKKEMSLTSHKTHNRQVWVFHRRNRSFEKYSSYEDIISLRKTFMSKLNACLMMSSQLMTSTKDYTIWIAYWLFSIWLLGKIYTI